MRVVFGGLFLFFVFGVCFFLIFFFFNQIKRQHLAHDKACHFFDGLFFLPTPFYCFSYFRAKASLVEFSEMERFVVAFIFPDY